MRLQARKHATSDAAATAKQNASQECTAEEPADPAAFNAKYGTGKHGANAHGKCVSQKAKAKTAATVRRRGQGRRERRQGCKAERKADPAAFAAKYGTNKNKRNAFGKCVSKHAKAQEDHTS